MKNNLTYLIIGLGEFGKIVANELLLQGKQLILVDRANEPLKEFQDRVLRAFILDATNHLALLEAGLSGVDVAVLCLSSSTERSILALMALKEIGIKTIIAKSNSEIHGQILSKLGANKIIYPQKESAKRLVKEFLIHPKLESIDLSANSLRAIKLNITDELAHKNITQVAKNMRAIAHKTNGGEWILFPDSTTILNANDTLVLFGNLAGYKEFIKEF